MGGFLAWGDERPGADLTCRVCGRTAPAAHVATVTPPWRGPFEVRRCASCRSLELLDDPIESSSTDRHVDDYVEGGAGIGTIAEAIDQVDPGRVRRFLDVGCNYGFGLDLARFTHGWEVVGVEPSIAGRRGAAELDLDIRSVYLDEGTDLGEPFDLVLASEVIEHVLDPVAFARTLAAQLAPGGRLLLTTPAAEHVVPSSDETEVVVALSPGLHVFLAGADGLEQLLHRAGFGAVRVTRRRGTLHVVAAVDPDASLDADGGRIDAPALERYYAMRARSAPLDSALANGAATRVVRSAVSRGDFTAAADLVPTMLEAMRRRHGLDLAEPMAITAALEAGHEAPWHLANAAFALGMTALVHHDDPVRAAELFELTAAATRSWERQAGLLDLDSADLAVQATLHRALALARQPDGHQAPSATRALDLVTTTSPHRALTVAEMQCRVVVELVARGSYDAALALLDLAAARVATLATVAPLDCAVTVLDTTFSLGMLLLNTGRPEEAAAWFRRCARLADARGDAHAAHLGEASRTHLALADAARSSDLLHADDGWPGGAQIAHQVDVHWTDAAGTFLEGWAHLGPEAVREITVRVGDRSVSSPPHPTPHLLQYWPDVPEVAAAGFSAYVPGSPHGAVALVLRTDEREVELRLDLPAEQLPELEMFDALSTATEHIRKLIADAPPGPVLAIGIRSASEAMLAMHTDVFGGREHVGFDIHPGLGVDVVGDAHRLAELVPNDHFAVVVSSSVLEHLAMPWIVAAECAKVLRPGGLAIHLAPWTWPTHAQPNDFWRMSSNGLRQLFGPATGFRVVAGGDVESAVIIPTGPRRVDEIRMPTTASASTSWVAAEKVDDRARDLRWTYDADEGATLARSYPTEALSERPPTAERTR